LGLSGSANSLSLDLVYYLNLLMTSSISRKKLMSATAFCLLFFSFYLNLWNIAPQEKYESFEPYGEAHIVGKLARSERDGVFFQSGFLGVNYDKDLYSVDFENNKENRQNRPFIDINYEMYLEELAHYSGDKAIANGYYPYLSFIGGQGIVYSLLNKISPLSNSINYQLFRIINCALLASCFLLFLGWVHRNFGWIASVILFILLFLSQWIVLFCGNGLWWALWSFYLPFIIPLLFLEKRHQHPDRTLDTRIYLWIALTIFLKCFLTGFEFITTTLCIPICPIVYYHILGKKTFKSLSISMLKSSLAIIGGVFIYMLAYTLQLSTLFGNLSDALDYLHQSYVTRTEFTDDSFVGNVKYILLTYMSGESFSWGFFQFGFKFKFLYTFIIIFLFNIIVHHLAKITESRKYRALLATDRKSVV